jgi:hypothetical protein
MTQNARKTKNGQIIIEKPNGMTYLRLLQIYTFRKATMQTKRAMR